MYGYIYKIINKTNKKIYIGQTTVNPQTRWTEHLYTLKMKKHRNIHLQRAFNKYGIKSFSFNILNWANSQEELNQLEIYFITKYDCLNRNKGYNIKEGGSKGKLSDETKKKMSISRSGEKHYLYGKYHSESTKLKMSNSAKGRIVSNETRNKIGKIHKGRKRSQKTRIAISKSLKYRLVGIDERIKKSKVRKPFNYMGVALRNDVNPENKCWKTSLNYKGKTTFLGMFIDPISASIVYNFVLNEIFGLK